MSLSRWLPVAFGVLTILALPPPGAAATAERTCILQVCKQEKKLCSRAVREEYRADKALCAGLDTKEERHECRKVRRARFRQNRTACVAAKRGCMLCCAGADPSLCGATLIDPQTPGYEQLGAGYDVFTAYADAEFVRNGVLDLSALNRRGKLGRYDVDKFTVHQYHGATVEEYTDAMSVSAGLSGSYKFFSGSINTTFSQMVGVTRDWSFATVQVKHRVHGLRVERMPSHELRQYLLPDVRMNLNDPEVAPATIFLLYGTHVIGGLVVGGRLDYNLSALINDEREKRNIGVYAEAKLEAGFASIGLNTSFDRETYARNYVSKEEFNLESLGGHGQASKVWTDGDYTAWVDTVFQHPVFCDFGADPWLVPIWELADGDCEDGSRCRQLHDAFEAYAEGQLIDIPSSTRTILTDVAVTTDVPSTAPGYQPLRDASGNATFAYVHRGVSSAATPTRQHDAIFEAVKVWIAYRAVPANTTTDPPINQVHVFTGDEEADAVYGPHPQTGLDMTTDTCEAADYYHTNPCPTPLCAYSCDNVYCAQPNTNLRELHFTTPGEAVPGPPIHALVLANAAALNTANDFATRKAALWWGPQDLNDDGLVNDTDVGRVLERVVWVTDPAGIPVNLNQAADNYYVYDYECPWGCCWVRTYIGAAPGQYLGYVPY